MSRWIDADALQDKAYKMNFNQRITERELALINYIIGTMPKDSSIDIVRCRECKYAHMTYGGDCKYCDMWKDDDGFCLELYLDGDFYCSYGERRE